MRRLLLEMRSLKTQMLSIPISAHEQGKGEGGRGKAQNTLPTHHSTGNVSPGHEMLAVDEAALEMGVSLPPFREGRLIFPSPSERHWLRWTLLSTTVLATGWFLYRNSSLCGSENLNRWLSTAAARARESYREHIELPLRRLVEEGTAQLKRRGPSVSEAEVWGERQALRRMLVDFERDNQSRIAQMHASSEGEMHAPMGQAMHASAGEGTGTLPGAEGREAMLGAEADSLAGVMAVYQGELRRPLLGVVRGSLVRSLLIQLHKLKCDVGTAMLELETVMRSQELTLALVAAMPALLLLAALGRATFSWMSLTPPDYEGMATEVRMQAVQLERALMAAGWSEEAGAKGKLAEQLGETLLLAARLQSALNCLFTRSGRLSRNQQLEWANIQDDLTLLEDVWRGASMKLETLRAMKRSYRAFLV
ncbi:MAG: hypothetical protein SGPRY_013202 [Prymnesium sp.]